MINKITPEYMMKSKKISVVIVLLLTPSIALKTWADHPASTPVEEVYVTGGAEAIRTLPGSATFIDADAIKEFDSTDLNDVLSQVPGVYIRFEDGYGLRPNIGIRGATSDRSQKITLMEDGILIAPSPYAAPAAYYIPNVNRMDAIEVFKGPAAIEYGPHTVGGALNMATRVVPDESTGELSATYGSDNYQKYRAFYGTTIDGDNGNEWGYWVDALRYSADGFKELDGQNTGFVRNDVNTKFQWQNQTGQYPQSLVVKLGYADEDSDETYIGLSDDDFNVNPVARYAASANDKFTSNHTQIHAIYAVELTQNFTLNTRAYVNRFTRAWDKFDGFWEPPEGCGGLPDCAPNVREVLARPQDHLREMGLLRGEINSNKEYEKIDITNNDRDYGSRGIEFRADYYWQFKNTENTTTFGLRWHSDFVERDHSPKAFDMVNGHLVFDGIARENKTLNKSQAEALALYASHELQWQKLKATAGIRVEDIDAKVTDFQILAAQMPGAIEQRSDTVFIPGLGIFYQLYDSLGLLAGVNKGFSPAVAGSGAEPEKSVNYEYGFRFSRGDLTTDIIGFYSDYSNLIGRCRVSDSDCETGVEFDGGAADILGFELTSDYIIALTPALDLPLSWVYTYTDATFPNSFVSGFSQWGTVIAGDDLPYTPRHQAKLGMGLEADTWKLKADINFTGKMRELPEQSEYVAGEFIPSYATVNLAFHFSPSHRWDALFAVENIFDKQVIVSRRPFGARPNQPLIAKAGMTYYF